MSDYSSEYMKPSIVMDSEGEEVRPDVAIPVWVALAVGIYNVAGPGQKIEQTYLERIDKINKEINIKIIVSLSCTMCPELVTSAQRIASLNKQITTEVYDIQHFKQLKDQYQIMSVPCMVINDQKVVFGKKNIEQILEIIENV